MPVFPKNRNFVNSMMIFICLVFFALCRIATAQYVYSVTAAPTPAPTAAPTTATTRAATTAPSATTGATTTQATNTGQSWLGTWVGTGAQLNYNTILQVNGISVDVYGIAYQNTVKLCKTATGYNIERIIPNRTIDDNWTFSMQTLFTRFSPKFASNLTMIYFDYGNKLICAYNITARFNQQGFQYIKTSPDGSMLEMTFVSNGVEGSYWFRRVADTCPTATASTPSAAMTTLSAAMTTARPANTTTVARTTTMMYSYG